MGLLDDLKNQAATQLQREQSSCETHDRNLRTVDTVLREIQNYLIELANSLNVLKPKVYRSFMLETTVQLDRLLQADYAVRERRMLQRAFFHVATDVQASATFTGDWDSGKVRLVLRNVEKLGDVEYLYDAEEVTREVLEELAKLLLGQQNKLRSLGKHQEMMRSTSRGRTIEIEYPKVPAAEQPAPAAGDNLLDNLKSLLKR